jgi:tetratricopeptide (TPR) repeat protein
VHKARPKPAPARPKVRLSGPPVHQRLDLTICFGLALAILIVFAQVRHFDFISLDDPMDVSRNVHVQAGLTLDSIKWACTAVISSNWIPATALSHVIDGQFFGMDAGMHHLVNVFFHLLASVMLFLALQRASRARWPSAFVAFLFAMHPLHVESVAWVAERKDVLCAFFWFLALYAYLRYAECPSVRRYLLVVAAFCLSLLSKPMAVTFPFTLLLLDVWPLRRTQIPKMLWEKVPLIAVSAASSFVTFFVQKGSGAVQSYPLALRIENALVSYLAYIGQMFWPAGLAVIYPYPHSIMGWQAAAALTTIIGVSVLAVAWWRVRPYFVTGWFWYLGTMVPVIGLVQVGAQSRADRYTYIPMVGLFILLAWGAGEIIERRPGTKAAFTTAAAVCCVACVALTWTQLGYWENSVTLFEHTIAVTADNWAAQGDLAVDLMEKGRKAESITHFEEAVRIRPDWVDAQNNLGGLLADTPGRAAEAIPHLEAALRLRPDLLQAHYNLAAALSKIPGKQSEFIVQLEAIQRIHPDPGIAKAIEVLRARSKQP